MSIDMHSYELPECTLTRAPELIPPASNTTPRHTLYLSNLDDQHFIRFTIKYLFLYHHHHLLLLHPTVESLKSSLASVLVHYYPLAGRLRSSVVSSNKRKLELECTGEGAMFVEAFMDITAQDFMTKLPNKSWRKLLFREEGYTFLTGPPLLIQATRLRCGGMILCVGINHCLCDGIGSAQFLNAWADVCRDAAAPLAVTPCWNREALSPAAVIGRRRRIQQMIQLPHPEYNLQIKIRSDNYDKLMRSCPTTSDAEQQEPLVPISIPFGSESILQLKKLYSCRSSSSSSCTSFEVLAAHVWRCWARSIGPSNPAGSRVLKLLFSVDIRTWMDPPLPEGYYGNGFVLACAECDSTALVAGGINNGNGLSIAVRAVQKAKEAARSDSHVRSVVELLEEQPRAIPDLESSLVVSQWSRLGLERVDFGSGKPIHVGPMTSEVYCVLLPAAVNVNGGGGVTVLMSVPESKAHMFKMLLTLQHSADPDDQYNEYNNYDHDINDGGGMDHQLLADDHDDHELMGTMTITESTKQAVVGCSNIIAYNKSTTPAAAAVLESF